MPSSEEKDCLFTRERMDSDWHVRSVGPQRTFERPGSDIKKAGYMRKLRVSSSFPIINTMKKKYFVLRSTSSSGPARLEYYDSEKNFKAGCPPKHPIHLHTCFNINKKYDSKHGKWGIVLFTRQEYFTVVTDSEAEMMSWLNVMVEYQGEYLPYGRAQRENYEMAWPVTVLPKGVFNVKASYRMGLNATCICLHKTESEAVDPDISIPLFTVKSVSTIDNVFRLELGHQAPTGKGELHFSVEDGSLAKHMHNTLISYMNAAVINQSSQPIVRRRTQDSHASSPGHRLDQKRPQSTPWQGINCPFGDNLSQIRPRTNTGESRYIPKGDKVEVSLPFKEKESSGVPDDLTPPTSPIHLDEILEMDMAQNGQTSGSDSTDTYMIMGGHAGGHQGFAGPIPISVPSHHVSAPLPMLSFSDSHHSPLPTVREGGSNEGYFPMEATISPASSTGVPRPEPAVCRLSEDTTGLPPRTYSLGSRPIKKEPGYMEMCPRAGPNDISRATSAPHIIINNLKVRKEATTDSPSHSPLSASLKSDDSDSFIEYMPMRPRTSSDSFNYRPRASSFGKLQPMSRPRSSSHGQGTRPFNKFSKLIPEQSRISLEPQLRTSHESSLPGSFESLTLSRESLAKTGHDIRKKTSSNASDYAEMRSTPSPQQRPDIDHAYMPMQVSAGTRRTSPHRVRSDSNSSGRKNQQVQSHVHDYTEMTPMKASSTPCGGDSYMNMDFSQQQGVNVRKSAASTPLTDSTYMNMEPESARHQPDPGRSVSMENVESYVLYDPQPVSDKLRTGSVGAKDKKTTRSTRKSSSLSMSSCSPTSSGMFLPQNTVSTSTRVGGSSDSIKKSSRQSSMEKNSSLGKDFRKKSGSMGSRPSSNKVFFIQHQLGHNSGGQRKPMDDLDDEYIEFSPTVTLGDKDSSRQKPVAFKSGRPTPTEDQAYTEYNPGQPQVFGSLKPFKSPGVMGFTAPQKVTAKDTSEYVGFEPGTNATQPTQQGPGRNDKMATLSQSQQSHHSINGQSKASLTQDDYVGYEPKAVPVSSAASGKGGEQVAPQGTVGQRVSMSVATSSAGQSPSDQDYVGYQPGTAVTNNSQLGKKMKLSQLCDEPPNRKSVDLKLQSYEYVGYQPGQSTLPSLKSPDTAVSFIQAPAQPLKPSAVQTSSSQQSLICPRNVPTEGTEEKALAPPFSLSKSLGKSGGSSKGAQDFLPSSRYSLSASDQPVMVQQPQLGVSDDSQYMSFNPGTPSSDLDAPLQPISSPCLLLGNSSPISELKVETAQSSVSPLRNEGKASPATLAQMCTPGSPSPQLFSKVRPTLSSSLECLNNNKQSCGPQPPCCSSDTKKLKSSGRSEIASSRQKHHSGSKSRKVSSDSEKLLSKVSKSESLVSNSSDSNLSGKVRLRMASGDKLSSGSDRSPLSPTHSCGAVEFFCGETNPSTGSWSLESKMAVVEAKIGHNIVDVTSGVTPVIKDVHVLSLGDMTAAISKEGAVLVRPGSSPCIQNLESREDDNRSSGGSDPTPMSSRSRHSIADLGYFQAGPSANTGNSSGGDGCSDELVFKPLNYVSLDLRSSEGQGDADWKLARCKNKNAANCEERPTPLSYAEIDFVRSESLNKGKSLTTVGGDKA